MTSTDTRSTTPESLREIPISRPGRYLAAAVLIGLPVLFALMYVLGLTTA